MAPICDLHIHSVYSDGTFTPEQLIRLAEKTDVSALALCDHNTVAGLPLFLKAAEGSNVRAVPGVELSTEYEGAELHILGLFLKEQYYGAVTAWTEQMLQCKEQSNRDLIAALRDAGIVLDYDRIRAGTPNGQVNRAVIAAEMVRCGYCGSIKEAFSKWLSQENGYFHPPRRPGALETVRFLKSIGAVVVLAHPFLNLDEADLREFLPKAVLAGLDAMEVFYPKFSREQTELAAKIVAEFGILPSGGSDFHGANKPDIRLGTGRDNLSIPCSVLDALAARAAQNS